MDVKSHVKDELRVLCTYHIAFQFRARAVEALAGSNPNRARALARPPLARRGAACAEAGAAYASADGAADRTSAATAYLEPRTTS